MPPKKKKRSKSMPKQSQSQRQSVVVNIGTSKTKSKPRKSRGRGGLPPPSYQHNLAPTFVTQQATDYNPVIGAIQGLTAKLNEQPRIQQSVTPLSSTVQGTSAEQMAGEAALRRAGPTADGFVPHASQARNTTVDYVMPREEIGTNRPRPTKFVINKQIREEDESFIDRMMKAETIRRADEYFTERLVKPTDDFQRLPSDKRASEKSDSSLKKSSDSSSDSSLKKSSGSSSDSSLKGSSIKSLKKSSGSSSDSSLKKSSGSSSDSSLKGSSIQSLKKSSGSSSDSEGPAASGGGPPRVFKTPPKVLAKARQQAQERKAKLDSIREKVEGRKPITTEERQFVMKSTGTKRLQRRLYLMDVMNRMDSDDQRSAKEKIKKGKKIVVDDI